MFKSESARGFKSLTLKILLSIITLLIIIRLILPYALLDYVDYRLNKIPGYSANIEDLSIELYKGSYTLKNLVLRKTNTRIPVPFFSAEKIQLAIEWRPLLKGHLVGQINLIAPRLNFVIDPTGRDEQTSIDDEWRNAVKALFPLNFNRITVNNGQAHLRNFKGKPSYDIYLKNINAQVDNLRNITKTQQLLISTLKVNGNTMDGADFYLIVKFNPFKKQPTFDLDGELKQMQVSAIKDFLTYYTKLDVKQGLFSLYVEAAAKNGKITGYAKPLLKNLQLHDPKPKDNPLKVIYKKAAQAVTKILENPQQKTVATRINIYGDINDPNTSIWSLIGNLLKNAFLQALLPKIDNSIKLQDINTTNSKATN